MLIKKDSHKRQHYSSGFTLIELLAVITVMGVVGTLMFGILFTTLRGANKSESLGTIQQNGEATMAQMVRTIRFASTIDDPVSCYSGTPSVPVSQSSITIRNKDIGVTTYSCDLDSGIIASNGASLIDSSSLAVTACSFDCLQNTPNDLPTMTITFTLGKKNNALVENNSLQTFTNSVTLRNVR